MAYQARVVTVVQGPCIMPGLVRTSPTGAAVPGGHDTIPFCPGKALPIRHRRNSTSSRRRNGAKGMVLVTQTSPTSVALRCVVFARSSSSKCGTSEGQQFGLLGEITLLPEEGDRITCISLVRHDSNGATGYLLWIGTSNGTLLVINAAPTAYPAGCYSRIALVCQLHQKAPSLNPKQFSVDQGHEAVVAICPGTAGTPSLRNPWSVAGDGTPISNNGAVYTRSVDVLHQSGWLVSFDEEQIETLIASTTPRATSPQAIDRLSLLHEWGLVQHAHTTTHRGVSSSATTDSIPVACASGAVRDVMKRCVGHLLESSSRGGADGGSSDLGTTAAACALLPVPGTSALDVLATSLSVKHQRVIVISGFGDYGPAFTFYSVNIRPEAALSVKSAALEVAGRITGAALRAVKGFWGRRTEVEETTPQHIYVSRPQHSHTPINSATAIDATAIKAHAIIVSPSSHYAAVVASNSDRIMILDLIMGTVCRLFKGCRQCDVQWVECPSSSCSAADARGRQRQGASTSAHFLIAIYHKIRGIVEFYSMRDAQRVTACRVESGLQLLRVEGVEPLSELLFVSADHSRCFSARLELLVRHVDESSDGVGEMLQMDDDSASLDVVLAKQLDTLLLTSQASSPHNPPTSEAPGSTSSMLGILRSVCSHQEKRWDYQLKQTASSQRNIDKLKDSIQLALVASHGVLLRHDAVDFTSIYDVSDCARAIRMIWVKFLGQPQGHEELVSSKRPSEQHNKPLTRAQQYHRIMLQEQALDLCCALLEPVPEHHQSATPQSLESAAPAAAADSEVTPTTSYWGASFLLSAMNFARSDDSATSAGQQHTTTSELLAKLVRKAGRIGEATIHSVANGTHWWAKVQSRVAQWCEDFTAIRISHQSNNENAEDFVNFTLPSARTLLRCFDVSGSVLAFQSKYHDTLVLRGLISLPRAEAGDTTVAESDLLVFADACFRHLREISLSAVLERQAPILAKLGVSGPAASLLLVTSLMRQRRDGKERRSLFRDIVFSSQTFGSATAAASGSAVTQLASGLRMCHLSSLVSGAAMLPALLVDNGSPALDQLVERAVMLMMAIASQPPVTPNTSLSQQYALQVSAQWVMRLVALEAYLKQQLSYSEHPTNLARVWSRFGSLCNGSDDQAKVSNRGGVHYLFPLAPQQMTLLNRAQQEVSSGNVAFVDINSLRIVYDDLNTTTEVLQHRLELQRALSWISALSSPSADEEVLHHHVVGADAAHTLQWSTEVFNRLGRPIVERQAIPNLIMPKTQVVHELSAAMALAATVLIPLRPVVSPDTLTWRNNQPPDRHLFGAASFSEALSHGGGEWMSLLALSKTVCAALRDKMYSSFQLSLMTNDDADVGVEVQRVVDSAVNDLYGDKHPSTGGGTKHHNNNLSSSSSRTLFPITTPEEVTALHNLARFLAFHHYAADGVYITLNDVSCLVGFLEWCFAQHTNSLRHGEILSTVPWTDMFAVTSFSLLNAEAIYPSLDVTHHALLAEQRSRSRLKFICTATALAVNALAQKSTARTQSTSSSLEQLQQLANHTRSFSLSLAEVLQQDALLVTGAADCALVAHVLRNKHLGEDSVNTFLRGITTQSSLRYPCAATMLLHLRRYIYTCIKWYASLEKGLAPGNKEGRTRHSNGSVKLRSSMSADFQMWLRNKTADDVVVQPSSSLSAPIDDDVLIGQSFYQQRDTDVAVDAHVRQSIGEKRLPQVLAGLRYVSEIVMANAQEFRHADRGNVGFDVTLGGLDRVTATLEQVLLEALSTSQN